MKIGDDDVNNYDGNYDDADDGDKLQIMMMIIDNASAGDDV